MSGRGRAEKKEGDREGVIKDRQKKKQGEILSTMLKLERERRTHTHKETGIQRTETKRMKFKFGSTY